jgi:hypothetical protein
LPPITAGRIWAWQASRRAWPAVMGSPVEVVAIPIDVTSSA